MPEPRHYKVTQKNFMEHVSGVYKVLSVNEDPNIPFVGKEPIPKADPHPKTFIKKVEDAVKEASEDFEDLTSSNRKIRRK